MPEYIAQAFGGPKCDHSPSESKSPQQLDCDYQAHHFGAIVCNCTHMPNGSARCICIVEGGCCSDTRYTHKLQGKEAQHQVLQTALQDYGYNVTTLPIIMRVIWVTLPHHYRCLMQIGTEHTQANSLLLKLHEYAVTSLHNTVMSRRVSEQGSQHGQRTQAEIGPLRGH